MKRAWTVEELVEHWGSRLWYQRNASCASHGGLDGQRDGGSHVARFGELDGEHRSRRHALHEPAPDASGENTPAIAAETYSPTLWPIIDAGSSPQDWNSRASAYSGAGHDGA